MQLQNRQAVQATWRRRLSARNFNFGAKSSNDQKNRIKRSVRQMNKGRGRNTGVAKYYVPCTHAGRCTEENCPCFQNNVFCTKYCGCDNECKVKYAGCLCNGKCSTLQCACYALGRECDPDLCRSCGAGRAPGSAGASTRKCRNVSLQYRLHQHVLLAPSLIPGAGWGLFTKKALLKDDFIHEYLGELISQEEAERRGRVYDKVCIWIATAPVVVNLVSG